MSEAKEQILVEDGASADEQPQRSMGWWLLVALNVIFVLVGQSAAFLLGRFYFDQGGNSQWLATLAQTCGFPILFIAYLFVPSSKENITSNNQPSFTKAALIYAVLGSDLAAVNILYAIGIKYLSASTCSLLSATQLAFNAIFSYYINRQKMSALIINCVIILTLSAALLSINGSDSDAPDGVSKKQYIFGMIATIACSALYALLFCGMQFSFQNILKKETFAVVLDMQIYTSLVASMIAAICLLTSGEWSSLPGEMDSYQAGKVSYVMTLIWTAVSWQVTSLGITGLIFLVSSLFGNTISTLSLATTPIASLIIFHDKFNGVKIIAMLLAFVGFTNYIYQNYLDELKLKRSRAVTHPPNVIPC